MNDKKLLIVEHSGANVQISQENDHIVLQGIFTTFSQKNRNGRIYESADFLPHVDALREKMKQHALLGELDHPKDFEVSLNNASHVIESLEYDAQNNCIVGKIRLLNTAKGRDAQALVKDGVPLHISSRAAGTVDESGHVHLQQLFTYDLVAEPGFANAVLTRVNEGVENSGVSALTKNALMSINESYNKLNEKFNKVQSGDTFEAYEIKEAANDNLIPQVGEEGATQTTDFGAKQINLNTRVADNGTDMNKQEKQENMTDDKYILYSDFQKYSEHLSDIIADLQSSIANYKTELMAIRDKKDEPHQTFKDGKTDNSAISDMVTKGTKAAPVVDSAAEKLAAMEENYNQLKKYCNYLAEMLDKSIAHQDYLAENLDHSIEYANYLGENLDNSIKYANYLGENLDHSIEYGKYIAENLDKTMAYQDYLAENLDNSISYADYVAENLDHSIAYSNYLGENLDDTISYQNYLAESLDKSIDYSNYLAENQNKSIKYQDYLAENLENSIKFSEYIAENVNNEGAAVVNEHNEAEVEEKTVEIPQANYQSELTEKLNSLINTVKTQYNEAKKLEAEVNESKKADAAELVNFNLINYMPQRLQEKWSALSDKRKQELLAESKMFVISNAASAAYFWNTRDFRDAYVEVKHVDEAKVATVEEKPAKPVVESVMNDDRMKMMAEQIKYRMRKY